MCFQLLLSPDAVIDDSRMALDDSDHFLADVVGFVIGRMLLLCAASCQLDRREYRLRCYAAHYDGGGVYCFGALCAGTYKDCWEVEYSGFFAEGTGIR